jgi:hypothetical protein
LSTASKDFKVKNGLQVNSGGTFGAPVVLPTPTDDTHATNKGYVDESIAYGLSTLEFNQQVASYTLSLSDKGKIVEISSGSENTLSIPLNSTAAFPVGTQINILQAGAGQTTITPVSGVEVFGTPGLKLRGQWSAATLVKRNTNSWVAIGDLSE